MIRRLFNAQENRAQWNNKTIICSRLMIYKVGTLKKTLSVLIQGSYSEAPVIASPRYYQRITSNDKMF